MKTTLILTGMAALAALAFVLPSSAETAHEIPAPAVVEAGNFYATQFHPERSSEAGARLLKNFLAVKL